MTRSGHVALSEKHAVLQREHQQLQSEYTRLREGYSSALDWLYRALGSQRL